MTATSGGALRVPPSVSFFVCILAVSLLGWAAPAAARKPPPRDFFGVVPQAPLTEGEWQRMEGTVGTVRLPVDWARLEPEPGLHEFEAVDEQVLAAARHGIEILPVVWNTPGWLSRDPLRSPLRFRGGSRAWASFLRVLVRRYGLGGVIWRDQKRKEPIRRWQIWNEPNFRLFWHPRPSPVEYARLLRVAARAIRGEDRQAQVVLAGVAPVGAGLLTWVFLRRLYRVPGAKKSFDMVALHPYAKSVAEMSRQVKDARTVMAEAGDDATPLLISELGVASWGSFASTFVKGPRGQALFLRRAFARLLSMRGRWRLAGVHWFSWRDRAQPDPHCSFCQGAGLLDLDGRPKPAWSAFRQAVKEAGVR